MVMCIGWTATEYPKTTFTMRLHQASDEPVGDISATWTSASATLKPLTFNPASGKRLFRTNATGVRR
ncbi:hypothetical protein DPMN_045258 [Dreissena polymorpha]|uniref:Uncharacterized protein n=1 Tax=Dreissena polymorpha TaxID=45954 RepID=A0A9D4D615_DREPO|nr:hypothetical protein DPMN_045258 [Dreissena polymorpha]